MGSHLLITLLLLKASPPFYSDYARICTCSSVKMYQSLYVLLKKNPTHSLSCICSPGPFRHVAYVASTFFRPLSFSLSCFFLLSLSFFLFCFRIFFLVSEPSIYTYLYLSPKLCLSRLFFGVSAFSPSVSDIGSKLPFLAHFLFFPH